MKQRYSALSSLSFSVLCTTLLVTAGYYSAQKQGLGAIILFSAIPTVIFGVLFAILLYYHENVAKMSREIDLMITNNNWMRTELINLYSLIAHTVEDAGEALNLYEPMRKLLNNLRLMSTLGAFCLPAMRWYTQAETECCRTGNRSLRTRVKASEEGVIWKILPALSCGRS